jgi:hypothetical protein
MYESFRFSGILAFSLYCFADAMHALLRLQVQPEASNIWTYSASFEHQMAQGRGIARCDPERILAISQREKGQAGD